MTSEALKAQLATLRRVRETAGSAPAYLDRPRHPPHIGGQDVLYDGIEGSDEYLLIEGLPDAWFRCRGPCAFEIVSLAGGVGVIQAGLTKDEDVVHWCT